MKPGETFTYEWTVQDTPAVGMYHSHHDAVEQVPDGLAGAFIVGDEPVPAGVTVSQEQVMMLDDAGVIGYALNGKSFPATAPIVAKQGEWVEVHYMNEGTQIHPMHLHGMPQLVIAKDGYPLADAVRPRTRSPSLPASATRCWSTPPSPACGCGTATSSPTPRTRTACSAWSPRSSCSDALGTFVLFFVQTALLFCSDDVTLIS